VGEITLLYTANLAGELALLPRLMTVIHQVRQTPVGSVFLIDLGDTCAVETWVCRATEGRAPFLVLDAMGYDAAVIGGPEQVPIPIPSLRKLIGSVGLSLIVWNRLAELTKRGITVTVAPGEVDLPEDQPGFRIDRATTALPEAGDPLPTLGDVAHGELARVDLSWPKCVVQNTQRIPITTDVPPDPTIAAVVDLVESEAAHYMQQP
jgi:hypothetical protein